MICKKLKAKKPKPSSLLSVLSKVSDKEYRAMNIASSGDDRKAHVDDMGNLPLHLRSRNICWEEMCTLPEEDRASGVMIEMVATDHPERAKITKLPKNKCIWCNNGNLSLLFGVTGHPRHSHFLVRTIEKLCSKATLKQFDLLLANLEGDLRFSNRARRGADYKHFIRVTPILLLHIRNRRDLANVKSLFDEGTGGTLPPIMFPTEEDDNDDNFPLELRQEEWASEWSKSEADEKGVLNLAIRDFGFRLVEAILKHCRRERKLEVLVQWYGLSPGRSTWQPAKPLKELRCLKEYMTKNRLKRF
ncbi:hypothetical protein ADUPG1_012122 [Aduncisulcus paluster]|uniref:Chromo domain-containing protein n=1 Tax=Aduncisulcus paluster TaxID=2918883 RepID=A0ABQ5JYE3_9EUKA|nr:hypothetical protein ADUPG1_012122 [Aduncisulcus paluster]